MNQFFLELQCYQPKNKAHEELQQFVSQFNHCLTDDEKLGRIKVDIKMKIDRVNAIHTRCQNIQLSGWQHTPRCESIAVDGNFHLSIKKVERFELAEPSSNEEIEKLKLKASKWDSLGRAVEKYYIDEDGNEVDPGQSDGLISIGEHTAAAFGWLGY